MLPIKKRLNLKKDFSYVRSGMRLEFGLMRLFVRFGDNNLARVGIATSSKDFKKAHERNKARRLCSYSFENVYPSLPDNINIIAFPKGNILNVKSNAVLLELKDCLLKNKIINEKASN